MGIPKKGSRTVETEGRKFRFLVKEARIEGHKDQKELSVVIQEDTEKPGNVLQFRAPYGMSITRNHIEFIVKEALIQGWQPEKRGAAFKLKDEVFLCLKKMVH